jgi:hypothetical protein
MTLILNSLGACNTPLERYFQDLSSGMLETFKFLQFELINQKKKQICSRLTSAYQGGQKNRNEETIAVLLYNVFY